MQTSEGQMDKKLPISVATFLLNVPINTPHGWTDPEDVSQGPLLPQLQPSAFPLGPCDPLPAYVI